MTIRVRAAGAADLGPLVRFNRAMAVETEAKDLDEEVLRRGVEAALGDRSRGRYWVAEDLSASGAVVGGLLVTREWSDWRNAWFWWIQSVFVDAECRGRGVYRALYEAVQREAKSAGDVCGIRLYVERENGVAQAVYERLGMSRTVYDMYEAGLTD